MKKKSPQISFSASAYQLNRWVTYQIDKYYTPTSQKRAVKVKKHYVIQWKAIWLDFLGLFETPLLTIPRIAFSLLAFWFIFQGKHEQAQYTAFVMGALAYDTSSQSSHSGEPNPVSVTVTVANVANRIALCFAAGFNAEPTVTFDGNATTDLWTAFGGLRGAYYLAPGTGSKSASFSGGAIKACGVIIYDGVHQTTPVGTAVTEDGSSSPNGMDLTTTTANALRIDAFRGVKDNASNNTTSLDAGTQRLNPETSQNQFRVKLHVYENSVASASSTTRTWTVDSFNRAYGAVELKAAATATAQTITASLKYTVKKSQTVTKSLKYTVKANTTIQKTIAYLVRKSITATKALIYLVKASSSVQKSLKYAVPTTQSVEKDLVYFIRLTEAVELDLVYKVTAPATIQKSLKYTVFSSATVQKDLVYQIVLTGLIQKSLVYVAAPSVTITKSLEYQVTAPSTLTKSLKYTVVASDQVTKDLVYSVVTSTAVELSLSYEINKRIYTKQAVNSLPADDANLTPFYTENQIADVALDDDIRVGQLGVNTQFIIHQFKYIHFNNTDPIILHWNGKTNLPPSISTVYLQIYNYDLADWETLDSDSTSPEDADFNLDGIITSNNSDYYGDNNRVTVRVYQEL